MVTPFWSVDGTLYQRRNIPGFKKKQVSAAWTHTNNGLCRCLHEFHQFFVLLARGVTVVPGISTSPGERGILIGLALSSHGRGRSRDSTAFLVCSARSWCPCSSQKCSSQSQSWSLVFHDFTSPFCSIWGLQLGVVTGQMGLQGNKEDASLGSLPVCTTPKSLLLHCT